MLDKPVKRLAASEVSRLTTPVITGVITNNKYHRRNLLK